EVNFSHEYWQEDPQQIPQDKNTFQLLQSLPRRARRDAYRTWRGSSLRTELYALDEQVNGVYVAGAGGKPYTVTESRYGIQLIASPQPLSQGEGLNGGNAGGQSPFGGGAGGGTVQQVLLTPRDSSGYIFFSFSTASRTT